MKYSAEISFNSESLSDLIIIGVLIPSKNTDYLAGAEISL